MLSSKHGGQVLGAPRDPAGQLSGSFREKPETCHLSVGNTVTLHMSVHVCSCVHLHGCAPVPTGRPPVLTVLLLIPEHLGVFSRKQVKECSK